MAVGTADPSVRVSLERVVALQALLGLHRGPSVKPQKEYQRRGQKNCRLPTKIDFVHKGTLDTIM